MLILEIVPLSSSVLAGIVSILVIAMLNRQGRLVMIAQLGVGGAVTAFLFILF